VDPDARSRFEPLYTAEEMKAAEQGHDVEQMMERAGRAVAAAVARDYPGARVVAVCGKGANGGDGRIAAGKLGAQVVEVGAELPDAEVVIDAIFGTGFHGDPREEAARSIEAIRGANAAVVAVDIPSGVNASTGEVGSVSVEAA
jgi:NAD(P)H-hydrate repair Nnr-like enzyme with NAD(P)H-hydrate epimerase domain